MSSDTATIAIRTDVETKREAQELFKDMGMDMTTAINMFLRQTISEHRLPFQPGLTPFERSVLKAASEPMQRVDSVEALMKEVRDA
ncbi:type II toxin-antitoxin system RelB/DinJ family antitoxin [Bifidobacterium aquikefiricola]|uniref:Type II toxin-antitoxin system RelB/DinJ family antitoxin n=1 Tax=Bifidobacterium aquikefiricola TaxID=3059038 RepID=A0AB39U6E2_9BIFI